MSILSYQSFICVLRNFKRVSKPGKRGAEEASQEDKLEWTKQGILQR